MKKEITKLKQNKMKEKVLSLMSFLWLFFKKNSFILFFITLLFILTCSIGSFIAKFDLSLNFKIICFVVLFVAMFLLGLVVSLLFASNKEGEELQKKIVESENKIKKNREIFEKIDGQILN